MKIFLALFVLTATLSAQIPNLKITAQEVPVLHEWWRADNKGYGLNGMTWLDNFYNGKGALVISTPSGVQTWQLRYPWDTVNVFTWEGGDAKLKIGNFDGDVSGKPDFLDSKGNLYLGDSTGFPRGPKFVLTDTLSTHLVIDLNNDGIDDVLSLSTNQKLTNIAARFGSRSDLTLQDSLMQLGEYFDSTRSVASLYTLPGNEHRLLIRYAPYYFDTKGKWITSQDGYELYSMVWSDNQKKLILTEISEIIINKSSQSWIVSNTLQPAKDKVYRIQTERIDPTDDYFLKTNLVIYDLSADTFNKIVETRMDSIGSPVVLNHSINGDGVPSWTVDKFIADGLIENTFFSGNFQSGLHKIGKYTAAYRMAITSCNDLNNDQVDDLVFSGRAGDPPMQFRVLSGMNSTGVSDPTTSNPRISVTVLSSSPISKTSQLSLRISGSRSSFVNTRLFDSLGKIVLSKIEPLLTNETTDILVDLRTLHLVPGTYYFEVRDRDCSSDCSFITY